MKLSEWKKLGIPDEPGVYFFTNNSKSVLYIGKATSLSSRTRSYFSKDLSQTRGNRIVEMVSNAKTISWQKTDSVLEALILEANLIKKFKPPYNSVGKDGRSFNVVVITNEPFPRIFLEREKILEDDNLDYKVRYSFGPYPSAGQIREGLKIIRKIFPFRDKKSTNPTEDRFYKQLQLSPDTSTEEARKKYLRTILNIKTILEGKKDKLLRQLERQMMYQAQKNNFEEASIIKKQLLSLRHINDVALIKEDVKEKFADKSIRIEAYDISHQNGSSMVGVMTVIEDGVPSKNEYRKFKVRGYAKANDTGALSEILSRRLAHTEWRYPQIVVVDGSTAQINAVRKVFEEVGVRIPIISVVKDEKHRPKGLKGSQVLISRYREALLLANYESHRFALSYLDKLRRQKGLNK